MPPSAAAGPLAAATPQPLVAATEAVLLQLRLHKGDTRKVSWKETAERYRVNVTTLRRHAEAARRGALSRIGAGRPTTLPESAEARLADWIQRQYDAENPVSIDETRVKAKELAGVYKCRFAGEGGLPSADWVRAFDKRHAVGKRKAQPRGTERLVTAERLAAAEDLFSKWEQALGLVSFHRGGRPVTYREAPHRILNLDEGPAQRNIGCRFV
ncbi:tigger transposable element-derived 6-like, partial [Chlorella sorokiniana]